MAHHQSDWPRSRALAAIVSSAIGCAPDPPSRRSQIPFLIGGLLANQVIGNLQYRTAWSRSRRWARSTALAPGTPVCNTIASSSASLSADTPLASSRSRGRSLTSRSVMRSRLVVVSAMPHPHLLCCLRATNVAHARHCIRKLRTCVLSTVAGKRSGVHFVSKELLDITIHPNHLVGVVALSGCW